MRRLTLALLLAVVAGACAHRGIALPAGEGEPFPEYAAAFDEAARPCRDVRSLSAELAVSGRVGGGKVRIRVIAGISATGGLRLEGVAPFGPPAFVLAASGGTATLLLPRDNRVLRGERASAVLDALVGLDLDAADLLALLTGCVVPAPGVSGGRQYASGWARIDLAGGAAVFLHRDAGQAWRIRAGARPPLRVEYEPGAGAAPATVHLRLDGDRGRSSGLRIALSQVELDARLGPGVFTVSIPADARPITLAELRAASPAGERR